MGGVKKEKQRRKMSRLTSILQLSNPKSVQAALAPSSDPASAATRQDVETLVKQLKDLRTDPQPTLLGASASDPFADLSPAPDIDGKWELM